MAGETGAELPKYWRIADDLKAAIEAGDYRPGDRLPGETALAGQYGVASLTARQALKLLRSEGLVETKKGASARVAAFRPIRRHGIPRVARSHWGAGKSIWAADDDRTPDVDQISVADDMPPARIRGVLELGPDETTCIRSRRYSIEGRPIALATSYLPQTLVAGTAITQADPGPGGIYARLADLGHAPARFQEEVRGRMPTVDDATRLSIPVDRFVLNVVRTAFDADGRAVEVNEMTLDSAAYVLAYEFDA
ncbi:GntR family transcriptional regulator [Streptomyces sp. Edi4]|uniref:GntR family transcriptional regulator n=1 Tax=Streptomyces sp. Edi4 TaxID=3162527 RepID=UPI0033058564